MLLSYENRNVYIASQPVDFRMSIDGLSRFIQRHMPNHIHDGSIYTFYNQKKDKIKCLYWDRNGFVLHYKRFDKCTLKIQKMLKTIESISPEELEVLFSGMESHEVARHPFLIEHKG